MADVTSLCRKCGQKKPVKSFSMSLEAGKMVCAECLKTLKGTKKPTVRNDYTPAFADKAASPKPASSKITNSYQPAYPQARPAVATTKVLNIEKVTPKPEDYDKYDRQRERMSKKKSTIGSGNG